MPIDGGAAAMKDEEVAAVLPLPMAGLSGVPVAPFLMKTYEMVEDAGTDEVVSWTGARNSFVVWDPFRVSRELLPRYFKHGNFSSFVRQLNTYGFRKVHPDRWEFAHEKFLGGQKHLLKDMKRRVNGGQSSQQKLGVESSVELGPFGLESEVDKLNRDRDILMAEITRLNQQQEISHSQLVTMEKRVRGTERMQQKIVAFLARALKNPSFIEQLQLQGELKRQQLECSGRKRRLTATPGSENLQADRWSIESDLENRLSTMGNDRDNSSTAEKGEAVLRSGDQDDWDSLKEFLDIGMEQGDDHPEVDVEVEDLAADQYDWDNLKGMVDEIDYLGSQS